MIHAAIFYDGPLPMMAQAEPVEEAHDQPTCWSQHVQLDVCPYSSRPFCRQVPACTQPALPWSHGTQ